MVIQNLFNPIQTYFVVAVIFIVINYALSKLAEYVERRLSRARRSAATPETAEQTRTLAGAGVGGA